MSKNTCGECRYYVSNPGYGACCTFICDAVCDDDRACERFAPPTNGDRIRQMSNEELAEFLTNPPCFVCSKGDAAGECTDTWRKKDCKSAILEYLNAPAKEGGEDD